METIYKIKKPVRILMSVAAILSIPVLFDVVQKGAPKEHLYLFIPLVIIFFILVINNLLRKIIISEQGVSSAGIAGKRFAAWTDISLVDGVTIGSKQFINISCNKKSIFIPNSFENFPELANNIRQRSPEGLHGQGLINIINNPSERRADIIISAVVVILLAAILATRFFPR